MAILGAAYQYFAGSVSLAFVQSVGRAYEFQLTNDTPSDRTVTSFRIIPRRPASDLQSHRGCVCHPRRKGQITLPGGNQSYVPAAEFKELDGQRLSANASFKFRVPPLSNRTWMAPEAPSSIFVMKSTRQTLYLPLLKAYLTSLASTPASTPFATWSLKTTGRLLVQTPSTRRFAYSAATATRWRSQAVAPTFESPRVKTQKPERKFRLFIPTAQPLSGARAPWTPAAPTRGASRPAFGQIGV